MNEKSLKITIIALLLIIIGGVSFYFYNEYRKEKMVKNALLELAEELEEAGSLDQSNTDILPEASNTDLKDTFNTEAELPRNFPSKPANCQIEIANKSLYNNACNFEMTGQGSFNITGFDINQSLIGHVQEISVEVKEPGIATVFGSNNQGPIHEWGEAKRTKGCWVGSNFKVCAHAIDSNPKTSEIAKNVNTSDTNPKAMNRAEKDKLINEMRESLDANTEIPAEFKIVAYCEAKASINYPGDSSAEKNARHAENLSCLNGGNIY